MSLFSFQNAPRNALAIWGEALLTSVFVRHELPSLQRGVVVVGTLHRALWQLDLLARDLFVRDEIQDVREAIEPGALLVV